MQYRTYTVKYTNNKNVLPITLYIKSLLSDTKLVLYIKNEQGKPKGYCKPVHACVELYDPHVSPRKQKGEKSYLDILFISFDPISQV